MKGTVVEVSHVGQGFILDLLLLLWLLLMEELFKGDAPTASVPYLSQISITNFNKWTNIGCSVLMLLCDANKLKY